MTIVLHIIEVYLTDLMGFDFDHFTLCRLALGNNDSLETIDLTRF